MLSRQTEEKYTRLRNILADLGSVVIGYSGGVDSTLLLRVATDIIGRRALAVIGRSETYPSAEYQEAVRLAENFGARHTAVATEETDLLKFRDNPPDRCYFCKTELFTKLTDIAERENIPWIADGTNADDVADFRPGMRAKEERNVRSPLLEAGLSKNEVREISRHLGLSTWNKPSFACLSSRFPYGSGITKEKLSKVDKAEAFLRAAGFRHCRVRHHDERTARIELGANELHRLFDENTRTAVLLKLKELGFTYVTVDLQGYRLGSMNEVLSESAKEFYAKGA